MISQEILRENQGSQQALSVSVMLTLTLEFLEVIERKIEMEKGRNVSSVVKGTFDDQSSLPV